MLNFINYCHMGGILIMLLFEYVYVNSHSNKCSLLT